MNHPFLPSSESSWIRNLRPFFFPDTLAVRVLSVTYLKLPNVQIKCFPLCYCVQKHCHGNSGIFWEYKGTKTVWLISHLEGVVCHGTLVLKVYQSNSSKFWNLLRNVNCCWSILCFILFCICLAPISHRTKLSKVVHNSCYSESALWVIYFQHTSNQYFSQPTTGQTLKSTGQSLCPKLVCWTDSLKLVSLKVFIVTCAALESSLKCYVFVKTVGHRGETRYD